MHVFSNLFKFIFTVVFMLISVIPICLKIDINLSIFIALFEFSPTYEQEKEENPSNLQVFRYAKGQKIYI